MQYLKQATVTLGKAEKQHGKMNWLTAHGCTQWLRSLAIIMTEMTHDENTRYLIKFYTSTLKRKKWQVGCLFK